ncbi:MAG: M28 family peptidase [Crocinitomicaceae bacterium]
MRSFLLLGMGLFTSLIWTQIDEEKEIMKQLCSPEFHGRGYVENGMNLAADYIAKEFKLFGAEPAGFANSYFHDFSLNVNTFPGIMAVKSKKRVLSPGVHYLVNSSSGSFNGKVKLVPFDAFKLIHQNKKEIEKLTKLKDNSAILLDLTPYTSRDTINLFHEISIELGNLRPVILITDEKFMWSVGRFELKFPIILIQDSVFNDEKSMEIHIENKFIKNFKTKNVVAKVAGKSSDSCFVFTAHFDHLGRMGKEVYFPGANDNASGTTMLLSLAKYFAENQPKYDLYFIAFGAEEAGLVGSKAFVDDPSFDIHKIKFLMNLDIMGSGDEGITVVNGTLYKDQFELLSKLNEDKSLLPIIKSRGKTQNSDHYFFQEEGILTFFIYTMGKNKAYHDIFDQYETLDMDKFEDLKTLLIDYILVYP